MREVECELCFEENILVSIDEGERASQSVTWLSKNAKRGMNLIYVDDKKVSIWACQGNCLKG